MLAYHEFTFKVEGMVNRAGTLSRRLTLGQPEEKSEKIDHQSSSLFCLGDLLGSFT